VCGRQAGTLEPLANEVVIYREEALTVMGVLGDIRHELVKIRGLLEEDDGEEEEEENA
jgi:hypothetical protein